MEWVAEVIWVVSCSHSYLKILNNILDRNRGDPGHCGTDGGAGEDGECGEDGANAQDIEVYYVF